MLASIGSFFWLSCWNEDSAGFAYIPNRRYRDLWFFKVTVLFGLPCLSSKVKGRYERRSIYCVVYCDLILFHQIVIHTCPPFISRNYAPTHDPPTGKRRKKKRIRNRIEILPPDVPAAYPQFPVSLLSERMKTGKSTLPPTGTAVKLQLPVFLPSERRKTGKGLYRRCKRR